MRVFKTYLLILKANVKSLGIYSIVFLAMALGTTMIGSDSADEKLVSSNIKTSIINEDGESELVNGLIDYIGANSKIVELKTDKESLGDALIFRGVEYIVRIPKGFSEHFNQQNEVSMGKIQVEASYSGAFMDQLINGYLNKWKQYENSKFELDQTEIRTLVQNDTEKTATVHVTGNSKVKEKRSQLVYFYNFLAYAVLGSIMTATVAGFSAFYKKGVKRRNDCSPMQSQRRTLEMILGGFFFSGILYIVYNGFGMILFRQERFSFVRGGMMLGLVFVFLIAMLLGVLITIVVESDQARSALVTTVSLVLAFLSGMFVPQDQLSGLVKTLAQFTPTFWYIKGNNELADMSTFSWMNLGSFQKGILIQAGFCLALLSIILVLIKYKQQEE